MPETLLRILNLFLLALIYLFFLRVLRAVWAELRARPATAGGSAPAGGGATSLRGRDKGQPGSRLKVVEPSAAKGRVYDLLADEVTAGRAAGCQIRLDDNTVSQLHARIFRRDGKLFVEDLGSTNGTYLNRKTVTGAAVAMRRGDRLQIGKTVFEVVK